MCALLVCVFNPFDSVINFEKKIRQSLGPTVEYILSDTIAIFVGNWSASEICCNSIETLLENM